MVTQPKKSAALGHGVFVIVERDRRRIELRQVPALRKLIGERLVAALVVAFNASERMIAMADIGIGIKGDDPRSARNRHHISMLQFAALHEGVSALDGIRATGIEGLLPASTAWAKLDVIRKRWGKDRRLSVMRHAFGHHLGAKEIGVGLTKIPHGEHVVAVEATGDGALGRSFPIALRALGAGISLQQKDLTEIGEPAIRDAKAYSDNVELLFVELLQWAGVRIA